MCVTKIAVFSHVYLFIHRANDNESKLTSLLGKLSPRRSALQIRRQSPGPVQ